MDSLAPALLVAAPPLGDPNFDRSVVLLAAHGPDGAFGWVINGREIMSLAELLVRADITDRLVEVRGNVRAGGPVSPEQVWLLYKKEDRFEGIEGQFEVGDAIMASASRRVLEAIAAGTPPGSLVGLGLAVWAVIRLGHSPRVVRQMTPEITAIVQRAGLPTSLNTIPGHSQPCCG